MRVGRGQDRSFSGIGDCLVPCFYLLGKSLINDILAGNELLMPKSHWIWKKSIEPGRKSREAALLTREVGNIFVRSGQGRALSHGNGCGQVQNIRGFDSLDEKAKAPPIDKPRQRSFWLLRFDQAPL